MRNGRVEADLDDLVVTAVRLLGVAEEAGRAFETHHSALSEAASGLFSASGRALTQKADGWRQRGTNLAAMVGDHGTNLQRTAWRYGSTDAANAIGLRPQHAGGDMSGRPELRL